MVGSRKILIWDLDDDLQGFAKEEEVQNSWHGMCYEKFWSTNEEMLNNGYRVICVKWTSSTCKTDIVNATAKQKEQ